MSSSMKGGFVRDDATGALIVNDPRIGQAAELEQARIMNTTPEASGSGRGATPRVMARDPATGTVASVVGAAFLATPTVVLYGAVNNIVMKSTDAGATWTTMATVAGYTSVDFIKVLSTGTVLIVARNGSVDAVAYDILRSTDGGTTFTAVASQPFTRVTPFSRLLSPLSWVQMPGGDLYIGEYGANAGPGPMRILKSSDDGLTYSTVATFSSGNAAGTAAAGPMAFDQIRHIHALIADPYVAGRIWITIGDNTAGVNAAEPRIGYSDDGCVTFTQITRATLQTPVSANSSYAQSRAVGLMFSSTAVFWFGDTPDVSTYLYRYDRATATITTVAGPFPNSGVAMAQTLTMPDGQKMMFVALSVEPTVQVNRDDMLRILGSADDGVNWQEALTWRRTQANQTSIAGVWSFTAPDANGAFWACLENVDGAEQTSNIINVKFQPRRRNTLDRARSYANHRDRFELAAAEGNVTFVHPDTAGAGASAAVPDLQFFQAPADLIIVSFSLMARGAVASHATNFWTPELSFWRAGASQGTVGQAGGANVAIVANAQITQLNANGLHKLKAGDWLALKAAIGGAPANLIGLTASVRFRRANAIV